MSSENSLGKVYIRAKADFNRIRHYIYPGYTDKQLAFKVRLHQNSHFKLHMPFLTSKEGKELESNMSIIHSKPHFHGHEENLKYMILTLADIYMTEHSFIRLSNQESTKRVREFFKGINTLFENEDKEFRVSFEEKVFNPRKSGLDKRRKGVSARFNDSIVSDWIIKTLREAITVGKVPLTIGTQLFDAHIVASTSDRKYHYYQENKPLGSYEFVEPDTIYTETITQICVPVINYLNNETTFRKNRQKYWSQAQLGYLVEILITIGFYESKVKNFHIGSKNPPVADKKYLQRTLENKIKQGYLELKSGTLTPIP